MTEEEQIEPSSLPSLRERAVSLARYACNGGEGRVLGDPVFEEITEKRAHAKGYSACGDLAMWVILKLGLHDEKIVNRNDDGGVKPWAMGQNLSRLVYRTGNAFIWARAERRPKPGDVLYIATPEHVCILEGIDELEGTIATFDYGQFNAKLGKPSGCRRVSKFSVANGKMRVGTRTLRGWVDIDRLFYFENNSLETA